MRAARGAVGGGALHAAQGGGAAHHQDLAGAALDHGGRDGAHQARQRVDQRGEDVAPFGLGDLERRGRWGRDGEVGDQDVDAPGRVDDALGGIGLDELIGVGDHLGALLREDLAQHGAHEGGRLGDEDALAGQCVFHDPFPRVFAARANAGCVPLLIASGRALGWRSRRARWRSGGHAGGSGFRLRAAC